MKGNHLRRILVLAVATSLLLAAVWAVVDPVRASLGNRGVPVRCRESGDFIPIGETLFFDCVAADGTPFTDGQHVPEGYYLLVTDVIVTSAGGYGKSSLWLYDVLEDDTRDYVLKLQSWSDGLGNPTFGFHFTTPYMVLPAGHRLEGENRDSAVNITVFVSGLLVTNVSYLPLVVK